MLFVQILPEPKTDFIRTCAAMLLELAVAVEALGRLVFLKSRDCHSMAQNACQNQDIRPVLHCDVVYCGTGVGVEDGGVPSCSSFTFFAAGVDIKLYC